MQKNFSKEIINDLLAGDTTDKSLLGSYKENLREMYTHFVQSKKYREELTNDGRDSFGFTFKKLAAMFDSLDELIEN